MKTIRLVMIVVALCAVGAMAQKPKTVDEAVQVIKTKWLKPTDLDWILRNPKEQVVWTLYRPFGTGVRNEFGLWGDNQALRNSCGDQNPEGCSVVIFNHLWESVRRDADPAIVRQLDCQFQLAQAVRINYKGFYKLTTGGLIEAIQSQINNQMAELPSDAPPPCQSSLIIETQGNPDVHCFVDASFALPRKDLPKDQTTETSLEQLLSWLGFRNFFSASHVPPKITLNYSRRCQFSTPPYLYGSPH